MDSKNCFLLNKIVAAILTQGDAWSKLAVDVQYKIIIWEFLWN